MNYLSFTSRVGGGATMSPVNRKEAGMPQILVTTDGPEGEEGVVLLQERIGLLDLESDSFTAHLIERLGWALVDADDLEHAGPAARRSEFGDRSRR
jgi:hypothetical protein